MSNYGFSVTLDQPFEATVDRVVAALGQQGFGVLSDIDVQKTLKAKLGIERGPYRILGACNPGYASRAIEAEPDIGLLLPCNVIVRGEADGRTTVGFMDPVAVLGLVGNPAVDPVGADVLALLRKVRDSLGAAS
ncbi:MAG: DUF302 domain-containing protein [Burkholderiaceae bacterium]|nr:DUF302 domain-containing protein [Burkholderiaceae bacterium]